jgi:hypothetical protein
MRVVIVRYKVKPAKLDEHIGLVRAVFADLARSPKAGFRYAAVRAPDGVSFTHISQIEEAGNPLADRPSFQAFQRDIAARCDERPTSIEVEVVGDFHLLG